MPPLTIIGSIKALLRQLELRRRLGHRGYSAYLSRAREPKLLAHRFANGITTAFDPHVAANWAISHRRPSVVILIGAVTPATAQWVLDARHVVGSHFIMASGSSGPLRQVPEEYYSELPGLESMAAADFVAIRSHLQRMWRRCDLTFLDLDNPLPDPALIIRLQHVAQAFDHEHELGIVSPATSVGGEIVPGYQFDRSAARIVLARRAGSDFGQDAIPRYSLVVPAHGVYITSHALDTVAAATAELAGLPFDDQVAAFTAAAWRQNVTALTYPPVVYAVVARPQLATTEAIIGWQLHRDIRDTQGRIRVIYVLNATSISGGIRTVFEESAGLLEAGFAVEIWSLEGQPEWTELEIEVRQFRSYPDLLLALRNETAIKVATWWETAEIVWRASAHHGVPVYFAQEFESWFFPDDTLAQAAVVASYRREFTYLTIAEYTQGELQSLDLDVTHVRVGFDEDIYRVLPEVERDPDTVLAVGRSFFQKNFAMTRDAWLGLAESRPRLTLFGTEPGILDDPRVDYHVRPSNAGVNHLYNTATCFVQTSRHEGFSLPIIEAMAAGCPVITTDSHGNRGFIDDEVNCLVVEQDDVAGLTEAISRLLGDPKLQERLRQAGLRTASRYRWSVIHPEVAKFYETRLPSGASDAGVASASSQSIAQSP